MPGCCVDGCTNRSEKGFCLFRLPTGTTNNDRRNEWLQLIGKNTLPARAVICAVHFGNEQFEKRKDGRKLLRPYAIPNVLQKRTTETEQGTEETAKKVKYSEHVQNVDSISNTEENHATSIATNYPEVANTEVVHIKVCHTASNEDKEHIKRLQIALKKKMRECSLLKRKVRETEKREQRLEKIFTKDQTRYIENNTQKGASWSAKTINNALKLYVACGQKGYEELRRQNLPYPSIRTLQHRIQGLQFKPGILEDIFRMLQMKVQTFADVEKHAVLIIDEMSIKPGLQYDNSIAAVVG